jgi:hypothetical protein
VDLAILIFEDSERRTGAICWRGDNKPLYLEHPQFEGFETSWRSTWISQSAGSGATPPIDASSPLAGYSDENLNQQHLFYIDNLTRVHEIYRKGNSWFAGMVAS